MALANFSHPPTLSLPPPAMLFRPFRQHGNFRERRTQLTPSLSMTSSILPSMASRHTSMTQALAKTASLSTASQPITMSVTRAPVKTSSPSTASQLTSMAPAMSLHGWSTRSPLSLYTAGPQIAAQCSSSSTPACDSNTRELGNLKDGIKAVGANE